MILEETSTVAAAALPIAAFSDHLHIGTGFADDGSQDSVLETCLRAGISAIEARTGKVILEKDFSWRLTAWRQADEQALPVAPVRAITSLTTQDESGQATVHDLTTVRLIEDSNRPRISAVAGNLPMIPAGGLADVGFRAGMAATFDGLRDDMAQAVMLLAAEFYNNRGSDGEMGAALPVAVQSLIAPYRTVRVFGERF